MLRHQIQGAGRFFVIPLRGTPQNDNLTLQTLYFIIQKFEIWILESCLPVNLPKVDRQLRISP